MRHPTPEILEKVYELLCLTSPFKGWRMPPADEVEFRVVRMRGQDQADCQWNGDRHIIRIAANKHHSLRPLIETMAHEMIHIHLDRSYPRDRAHHGHRFCKHADLVCRLHTFDRGQF